MSAVFSAEASPASRPGIAPDTWPAPLRWGLLGLVAFVSAWVPMRGSLSGEVQALQRLQAQEAQLREDHRARLARVRPLEALRQQRLALVAQLAPWPDRDDPAGTPAWMEQLLTEIHRAGQERRLRFELFRPGPPVARPYYLEWPLTLRVVGHYHDIAAFVADLAGLPRLVTLERLALSPRTGEGAAAGGEAGGELGSLMTLEAQARVYRVRGAEARPAGAVGLDGPVAELLPSRASAAYTRTAGHDPFDARRLAGRPTAQTARVIPNPTRPLEAHPLSSLRVVGSLRQGDEVVALVQADSQVFQVPVGAALGRNRARVIRISEDGVTLRETARGPQGEPSVRTVVLPLQGW